MKAILLEQYNPNLIELIKGLKVSEIETPVPAENEILVKLSAAPCNPSDIAFMRGMYNVKKELPKAIGFEGCGIVVETGQNAKQFIGKRVSFFAQGSGHGTWAEFFLTKPGDCIFLNDNISDDQAACLFVNPFTAYALYESVKEKCGGTIVINAAAGQVGNFIRVFAKRDNVNIINIVRRDKHVDLLRNAGQKYVVSSRSDNYSDELKEIFSELKPLVALDAVGGASSGMLLNLMPENAELIVYGGLSGEPIGGIDVLDVIFKNKSVRGFDLNQYIKNTEKERFDELAVELQKMIVSGDVQTIIQSKYAAADAGAAIRKYITSMSDGKILLTFD
ncbi:MAG: hypothetical protein A2W91_12175 [Bacteroidetes bacterium GWF2_38_335]|nr:MAG: hypothetical protein A2W91_12175 [Bacteroidetes bacterium GWF2_38_335]OFY76929.1 MAG: hypothetical protein A2281_00290 [Bacteroidetes bacterium RIFOXYA12_FULL_38_20]HBS86779.1 hypothetical protein [Bacteroidales bacterium]